MRYFVGIDEAGYGPTLGPLAIAMAAVEAPDAAAAEAALLAMAPALADSKAVHKPGDLGRLERVALPAAAWLSGWPAATAAEWFAMLGEAAEVRAGLPWMAGAETLALPLHRAGSAWELPPSAVGVRPLSASGRLVHPRAMNEAAAQGINRQALEWDRIAELLRELPVDRPCTVLVDRLGGRHFYADLVAGIWPGTVVEILIEGATESAYRLHRPCGSELTIAFQVGADARSRLVAAASCIAKLARELHLHLFNQYWCQRFRWLKPTAGYPQDARRWLHQLGTGTIAVYGLDLVRGWSDDEGH